MTYQRQWAAEGDVAVRIRRCREPLPSTKLLYLKGQPRTVEPLELEIDQQLPEICSRHGRAAVSNKPVRACFYDTRQHPRAPRVGRANRKRNLLDGPDKLSPCSTILVGVWPICDLCERSGRRYRRVAKALLSIMAVNLIGMLIAFGMRWAGLEFEDSLVVPVALAVFPGSIPIGLLVVWLFKQGLEPVQFRPISDERMVFVHAHPCFRTAVLAMPGSLGLEDRPLAASPDTGTTPAIGDIASDPTEI
ncbi:hypothetical protein ACIBEH_05425 [Nocardia salmonicida]|uniref:hypothetical protein n=1 Tax=Nocardia salmonicida TaxID=53431 RepID=UPI0037A6B397